MQWEDICTMINMIFFVSLMPFLLSSSTQVLKGGRFYVPQGISSSKCLWRSDWTTARYPKVLDLPRALLCGYLFRSCCWISRWSHLQSRGDAHRWTISARFLRNFTVYFQCVTLPFLQLQFHWWENQNFRPQSFPQMDVKHKVNGCTFCLLGLKYTVWFPRYRQIQDHTPLWHC